MPIRPVDRTPSMESLTNFVPSDFAVGARTLAEVVAQYHRSPCAAAAADCPEPAVACPTWPDVVAAVGRAQDAGAFEG